jgi:hypothetical protein
MRSNAHPITADDDRDGQESQGARAAGLRAGLDGRIDPAVVTSDGHTLGHRSVSGIAHLG